MAAKIEPTDRQSAGAAMGSDDQLNQQILTIGPRFTRGRPSAEPSGGG